MLQELQRREVEEQMRNVYSDALLNALGFRFKNPLPADSAIAVRDALSPSTPGARKPTGAAAAAAQDAWDTL